MFVLAIILIAVLVFLAFRKGEVAGKADSESSLELLQRRFVNGEISREEYLEKKDILKG